jgi:hypothetical protein
MNNASNVGERKRKTPRVVEIIGPAGAGKTTLFTALRNYPEKILLSDFPDVRRVADSPFFVRYGLQLFPSLYHLSRKTSRPLSRREFAWMSIIKGWPFVLQKDLQKNHKIIVLDQGPVYLLAEMREFGPAYLLHEDARNFWQEIYCRWAATLDLIVWLDAEDIYLLERIQMRAKEHVVKHEPTPVVYDFLARYRRAYDYVVSELKNCPNGPQVLRFDTSIQRTAEIVSDLLTELEL